MTGDFWQTALLALMSPAVTIAVVTALQNRSARKAAKLEKDEEADRARPKADADAAAVNAETATELLQSVRSELVIERRERKELADEFREYRTLVETWAIDHSRWDREVVAQLRHANPDAVIPDPPPLKLR